jgi:DNA primase
MRGMGYTRESLDELRGKVDLLEVVSSSIKMQRSGIYYKGLCPFHNEKSPSFLLQKGDNHYHCFGCGAHGDAIAFLMNYMKMTFSEAVESLAEKFGVRLVESDPQNEAKQTAASRLKHAMNDAAKFYHFYLLYTEEGHKALEYLYNRGLDLNFIRTFEIGYAPKEESFFLKYMKEKGYGVDLLEEVGLVKKSNSRIRPFFESRVAIPIFDAFKNTIAFSCRKIDEATFGPKYINSPETPLFKKSHVLFGLSFSRRQIAMQHKALIVEGQIDALRLIEEGFDYTVSSQGTAFTEYHLKELLNLGVKRVYLAFDGDNAGQEAAVKVGQMFQKEAIEVFIVPLEEGQDPDTLLREQGSKAMLSKIESSVEYLPFLVAAFSKKGGTHTPAGKNDLVRTIVKMIHEWEHPLMVHEGLKRLCEIMQVPESVVVPDSSISKTYIAKTASLSQFNIDPSRILESDLLRWMLLADQTPFPVMEKIATNIKADDLVVPVCRDLFQILLNHYQERQDVNLITIAAALSDPEHQLFLAEVLQKKINLDRAKDSVDETLLKILQRNWMHKTEEIKTKIQSGGYSKDDVMELVKEFDMLKRAPPKVVS